MLTRAILFALFTCFTTFAVADAHACSCSRTTASQHIRSSDLVAFGRVTSVELLNGSGKATFVPTEVWKGTPGDVVTLLYGHGGSCGVSMKQGEEIVLFALAKGDGTYATSFCAWGGVRRKPLPPDYHAALRSYRSSLQEHRNTIAAHPDSIGPKVQHARFLLSQGDHPGARAAFEEIISLRPDLSFGYEGLADVLLRYRKYGAALAMLKRAVGLNPNDRDTRRLMNHTQIRLGKRLDYREVDLRGLVVRDLDLSGQNLKGTNFSGAALTNADFRGAQLDGAIFDHTDLSGANFTGASLRHAQLTDSDLNSANFSDADMTGAQLSGCRLERANLSGASLHGAGFRGTGFWPPAYWYENMVHARFDTEAFTGGGLSSRPSWQRRSQDPVSSSTRLTYFGMIELEVDETLFRQAGLSEHSHSILMLTGVNLTDAIYDCTTAWPEGMSVTGRGLILSEPACNG